MGRRRREAGAQGQERTTARSKATAQAQEAQTMRAAIYARVSTSGRAQDVSLQTRELREYCERRALDIVGEYTDVGVSGSKDSRPELNRLMADAKQRRFDAVCVWKLDRFGRSLRHLACFIREWATRFDFEGLVAAS
jgi:predicted site-specific integrase-resolvase